MKFKNNRIQKEWIFFQRKNKCNIALCNASQRLAEAVEKKLEKNTKENIYLLIKKIRKKLFKDLNNYEASWVTRALLHYWKYGSHMHLVKESDALEEVLVMRSMLMTSCDNDEGMHTSTILEQ